MFQQLLEVLRHKALLIVTPVIALLSAC